MKQIIQDLLNWYLAKLHDGGVLLVSLLMAIESSIVPLPSELVVPPAAHLAWTTGIPFLGQNLSGWSGLAAIVIAGAIGSWAGAAVMYWVSRLAGRPFILRFGKYFLIPPDKVEGAERWAARYGAFGVFASRLLPVVRHLIGIPAGIVRMSFLKYSLYTLVGAGLWTAVLSWLGVTVGAEISKGELHKVTFVLIGFLAVVGVLYYLFVHRQMSAKPAQPR